MLAAMSRSADRHDVAERLASAMRSSNMTMHSDRIRDADYIAALGFAGIHVRVAASLFRLAYTLEAAQFPAALEEVVRVVRRLNARRGWNLRNDRMREVAELSLRWVLCPVCPTCRGRKWLVAPGTGRLTDEACPACGGTGTQRIDTRYVADIAYEVDRMLHDAEGEIGARVRAALRP